MPRPGPPAKDPSLRQRTNSPDDWLDVPNVPYTGPHPDLPATRIVLDRFANRVEIPYTEHAHRWWEVICRMPHAALWDDAEWQFALGTAVVADSAFLGSASAAAQLNVREKVLGTTADYRRALRIRYVDPVTGAEIRTTGTPTGRKAASVRDTARTGKQVVEMSDYRDL